MAVVERGFLFAMGVIATQLILPLAAGAPVLLSKKLTDEVAGSDNRKARRERRRRRKRGGGGQEGKLDAKKLAPLECPKCGAPVPLEGKKFPCRHCDAEIVPPKEYVGAIEERLETAKDLVKAERMWRWSRWLTSPVLLWPARVLVVAWLGLVLFSAAALGDMWPGAVLFLAVILAIIFVIGGLAWIWGFAAERAKLPPRPKNEVFNAPAAEGTCTSCGAPVHFPDKRVAMLCLYCTAEAYRVEVAKAEERKAKSDHVAAKQSLLDAVVARRDLRNNFILFLAFMGIAEIFYAVVFTFYAIDQAVFG